jgi:hypothetical protein
VSTLIIYSKAERFEKAEDLVTPYLQIIASCWSRASRMEITIALFALGTMPVWGQEILQFGSNGKENNTNGREVDHIMR